MEHTAIEVRDGGFASVFEGGRQYKREPVNDAAARWLKRTANGFRPVSDRRAHRLERVYRHPEDYKQVRRFPRLPQQETLEPIKDFFDIPLTTTLTGQKFPYLVDGLVPEGELILITGVPGSFKSLFAESLAAAISKGREFLGRTTRQTMVLLLDRDNPQHRIAERRDMLNMVEPNYLRIWGSWHGNMPSIGDPRLEQMARAYRLVIIFDSFVRFHTADENSAKEMASIMAELRKLVTAGATVIVLHHDTKARNNKSKYRGSSDILAGVDVAFNLSVDRKSDPPTLTLECFKHRGMDEFTITMRPNFAHGRFDVISDSTVQESDRITAKLKAIMRAEPGLNQETLKERSGVPEHRLRKILNDKENRHWRFERPGGKEKCYYAI